MDKSPERAKPDDTNSLLHPPLRMAVKLQLVRGGIPSPTSSLRNGCKALAGEGWDTIVFALEMEFPGGL